MNKRTVSLVVVLIAILATPLAAQDSITTHRRWCFRGEPKSRCDAFWLTEFGVAAPLAYNRPGERGAFFTWELGLMANRGPKQGLGAAFFVQAGSGLDALGIRPRMRFWITPSTSIDVAPGVVLRGSEGGLGFSGHAAVNFGDYAALTTHFVVLPRFVYDGRRNPRVAVLAGGRLGSVPGAVVEGGTLALILAFFVWCASDNCFADY